MQKLRALRNSGSASQRFSSTSTLCMRAIWAAGPPNESRPIRAHTPADSRNDGVALSASAACDPSMPGSARLFQRRPIVPFALRIAAPAVERVIERHAGLELRQIVLVHAGIAE